MKKLNLSKIYKNAEVLSKTQMKQILGGTEPIDDGDVVCRECESDSDCTSGRKCLNVDKTCDGGKTMTRCMVPAFE